MEKNSVNISSIIFLGLSVIIAFCGNMFRKNNIANNIFCRAMNEGCTCLQMKSIFVGMTVFVIGYIVAILLFPKKDKKWVAVISIPLFHLIWALLSFGILILRIPYTKTTMIGVYVVIIFLLVTCRYRRRLLSTCKKLIDINYIIIALSITIILSTGILPIIMTGDSYNFILKYGIIMSNEGKLNFQSVGQYMSWTGLAGALMVGLACFCGLQSIQVFHYQIIISTLVLMLLWCNTRREIKKVCKEKYIFLPVLLLFSFPCIYMCAYIISNTYFMCFYLVFLFWFSGLEENKCRLDIAVISLILMWLCMWRIEAYVFVCFTMIVVSAYNSINKIEFLSICLPSILYELIYLIRFEIDRIGYDVPTLYTRSALAVFGICTLGICIYYAVYDTFFAKYFRGNMSKIIMIMLLLGIIVIGISNIDRMITDFSITIKNLSSIFWSGVPCIFIVVYCILMFMRPYYGYWDISFWGYVLFNFAICLGRANDLRLGIGDSYNRMLMSAIPLAVILLIDHIMVATNNQICARNK